MRDTLVFISLVEFHNRGSWAAVGTWGMGFHMEMGDEHTETQQKKSPFTIYSEKNPNYQQVISVKVRT